MSPTVTVELLDVARCRVSHLSSGRGIDTAVAPEYLGPRVEVDKQLAVAPRRIAALSVVVRLGSATSDTVRARLKRAAETCPVKASLHPLVYVDVGFEAE